MIKKNRGSIFSNESAFNAIRILVSIALALGLTFIVLLLLSNTPLQSFWTLLTGPFTKFRYFGNVIETAVPIIFSGLACSLLFRTGLFNLGIEGIYYISGVATAYVACKIALPAGIHPLVCILVSGLLGGVIMLIPGYLKAKFDANALVVSLMLNSIFLGVGIWFIKTYMRADDYSSIASPLFLNTAVLSRLEFTLPGGGAVKTRVTIGILLALLAALLVYLMLFKTKLGYQIRMTGLNPAFAKYSGMNAFALFMIVHFLSGFLGGVGSSVELLSIYTRFSWIALPGLGFTGALMAMMGKNNPWGIVVASIGISYLKTGAEIMSRSTVVPVEVVSIIEAVLVLLISSQYFLRGLRERKLLKEGMSK